MASKNKSMRIMPVNSTRTRKMKPWAKTNDKMLIPEKGGQGMRCEICDAWRAQAWRFPSGDRRVLCVHCARSVNKGLKE